LACYSGRRARARARQVVHLADRACMPSAGQRVAARCSALALCCASCRCVRRSHGYRVSCGHAPRITLDAARAGWPVTQMLLSGVGFRVYSPQQVVSCSNKAQLVAACSNAGLAVTSYEIGTISNSRPGLLRPEVPQSIRPCCVSLPLIMLHTWQAARGANIAVESVTHAAQCLTHA